MVQKYGSNYCKQIKNNRGQLGDTCYLDEVFVKINGVLHYLWRAVDQYGDEIDIWVQNSKNKKAAMRFFKRLHSANDDLSLVEFENSQLKVSSLA